MANDPVPVARQHLQTLLLASVAYSLGRRTYLPSEVCALVREYHAALEPATVRTLLRYIDAQAAWGYGDACDEREWRALAAFLEGLGEPGADAPGREPLQAN